MFHPTDRTRQIGPRSRQPVVPALEPEVDSGAARGGAQPGPQVLVGDKYGHRFIDLARRPGPHHDAVDPVAHRLSDAAGRGGHRTTPVVGAAAAAFPAFIAEPMPCGQLADAASSSGCVVTDDMCFS